MDHSLDLLLIKHGGKRGGITNVHLVEAGRRVHGPTEAGLEVVHHHHVASGIDKRIDGVGANVAGPTQYENGHNVPFSP